MIKEIVALQVLHLIWLTLLDNTETLVKDNTAQLIHGLINKIKEKTLPVQGIKLDLKLLHIGTLRDLTRILIFHIRLNREAIQMVMVICSLNNNYHFKFRVKVIKLVTHMYPSLIHIQRPTHIIKVVLIIQVTIIRLIVISNNLILKRT